MKCPLCETPVAPGDSFCEACGHPLGSPDCESCGASAVDAEGYCERCGVRQTTDRDHAEIVLDASGAAAVTDRGLRRARNEDAMAMTPLEHPDDARTIPYGPTTTPAAGADLPNVTPATYGAEVGVAAVVCDGVGSSPRADEASAAAVTAAAAALAEGRTHEEAFALASRAVGRLATSPDDAPACTYVAAVARPGEVTICWAGDTRAYWLADVAAPGGGVRREGMLLTEDDSAPTGEITAWLGADYPDVRPRIRTFTPPGPGLLLVCSDGLWRYLAGYRFPAAGPPIEQARQMLRHALDSGGHDNVTIALIPLGGTHG